MKKTMGITPKTTKQVAPTKRATPKPTNPNTGTDKINKPTTPDKWIKGPAPFWKRKAR